MGRVPSRHCGWQRLLGGTGSRTLGAMTSLRPSSQRPFTPHLKRGAIVAALVLVAAIVAALMLGTRSRGPAPAPVAPGSGRHAAGRRDGRARDRLAGVGAAFVPGRLHRVLDDPGLGPADVVAGPGPGDAGGRRPDPAADRRRLRRPRGVVADQGAARVAVRVDARLAAAGQPDHPADPRQGHPRSQPGDGHAGGGGALGEDRAGRASPRQRHRAGDRQRA